MILMTVVAAPAKVRCLRSANAEGQPSLCRISVVVRRGIFVSRQMPSPEVDSITGLARSICDSAESSGATRIDVGSNPGSMTTSSLIARLEQPSCTSVAPITAQRGTIILDSILSPAPRDAVPAPGTDRQRQKVNFEICEDV